MWNPYIIIKASGLFDVSFRMQLFSTCSYGNPFARSNASSVGRPSAKRTNWISTWGFTDGKGTALWLVTSATRASSTAVLLRATWSSTWTRKHTPAFSVPSPLTAWICLKIMWPSMSMMAISPALPAKNGFQILSRWDAILIWSIAFGSLASTRLWIFQYCYRVMLHVSPFAQDKGIHVNWKLKRKSDQALLDVVLCHCSALSTKSLGVVLQSGIRRHCTVGWVVPYP